MGLAALAIIAILSPLATADTVIESNKIELIEAGSFDDPSSWAISTKSAFSEEPAEYSVGMVADGELSLLIIGQIISRHILLGPHTALPTQTFHLVHLMAPTLGQQVQILPCPAIHSVV